MLLSSLSLLLLSLLGERRQDEPARLGAPRRVRRRRHREQAGPDRGQSPMEEEPPTPTPET